MTGKYICNAVLAWREHPVDPFSPLALSLIYGISGACRNTRTGAELTRAASRTGFLGHGTRPVATGDCAANVSAARARPNPRHCEPLEAALLSHALRPHRAQTPPPTPPRCPAAPSDCCRAFARRPASYRRTADAAGNARSARAGDVTRSARAGNVCSSRTRRAFPGRRPRHPPPAPPHRLEWLLRRLRQAPRRPLPHGGRRARILTRAARVPAAGAG